jgi:LmbE family N-acetylglucosaminyl deacetylase
MPVSRAEDSQVDATGTEGTLLPSWSKRYEHILGYVRDLARVLESGQSIPLGPSVGAPAAGDLPWREPLASSTDRAKVLICSPHPDDEALAATLPLRMRLECGAKVTNIAITLGSDHAQRARRRRELESACAVLGFKLVIPSESGRPAAAPSGARESAQSVRASADRAHWGFDHVNISTRQQHPDLWASNVSALAAIFDHEQPDVVFAPHADDFHSTHVGTHFLAVDALAKYVQSSGRDSIMLIETEFWHHLRRPNLMVGIPADALALALLAATEHGGEMSRNAYHLSQPARLMDNVRRGAEVAGGQGSTAPSFPFAELYRVVFATANGIVEPEPGAYFIGPADPPDPRPLFETHSASRMH